MNGNMPTNPAYKQPLFTQTEFQQNKIKFYKIKRTKQEMDEVY